MPNWGIDWPWKKKSGAILVPPSPSNHFLRSMEERSEWLMEEVAKQSGMPILLIEELSNGDLIKIVDSPVFFDGLYIFERSRGLLGEGSQYMKPVGMYRLGGGKAQNLEKFRKIIGAIKMELVEKRGDKPEGGAG